MKIPNPDNVFISDVSYDEMGNVLESSLADRYVALSIKADAKMSSREELKEFEYLTDIFKATQSHLNVLYTKEQWKLQPSSGFTVEVEINGKYYHTYG